MDTNDFKDYCPNEELTELSEVRFYEGKNPHLEFIYGKCGKPKMIGYHTPKGKSMLTPCSCDCKKK